MGIIITPKIYTIGETLKQIRESHNCTQKYIAQMIGVEEMTVHYYEHNKRAIREQRAEDITKLFGLCKYALMNPTLENEIAVMHVINKIDSMYDMKTVRMPTGNIGIFFDKSYNTLNTYLHALHDYRELLGKGVIKDDEYLHFKFKMGYRDV